MDTKSRAPTAVAAPARDHEVEIAGVEVLLDRRGLSFFSNKQGDSKECSVSSIASMRTRFLFPIFNNGRTRCKLWDRTTWWIGCRLPSFRRKLDGQTRCPMAAKVQSTFRKAPQTSPVCYLVDTKQVCVSPVYPVQVSGWNMLCFTTLRRWISLQSMSRSCAIVDAKPWWVISTENGSQLHCDATRTYTM